MLNALARAVLEPGAPARENYFALKNYEIPQAIPLYTPPMRGAEFSSSAKREKAKVEASGRGARNVGLPTASDSEAQQPEASREVGEVVEVVEQAAPRSAPSATPSAVVDDARELRGSGERAEPAASEVWVRGDVLGGSVPAGNAARPPSSPAASAPSVASRSDVLTSPSVTALSSASVGSTPLSDYVVFNDEKLARKYAAEPIPISLLYEAYFDGSIDIPGDLVAFLRQRSAFVKHTITRQHLQWAVTNFVPEMVAHSRDADARAARELYDDKGEEFFRAFLGERMSLSCSHLESAADTLDRGCEQSAVRICEKIGLRASHRVLDVGCGWGAFLAHVAGTRGAEGVGVTLSRGQEAFANQRFAHLGIEQQVRALLADYRDLPAEKFDRIVCIEAVERVGVKNLKAFFEKLHDHLKDDGLLLLQWTGLRRHLRPEDLMWGLFINKYIFPGADAALPLSSMLKVAEKAGWEVQGVENVSRYYTRTLERWRRNWESNRERVVAAHGERWFRIWQFFLAWSQIVGEQGSAACFQVVMNRNLDHVDRSRIVQ